MSDLFIEGYTDALRDSLPPECRDAPLAPETLALILDDCARWRSLYPRHGRGDEKFAGAQVWQMRAKMRLGGLDDERFPPLTVTLADDGKIRLDPTP